MEKTLEELKKQREKYRHQSFVIMLEVGVIIAIPAAVAFFLGKYLDQQNPGEKTYTLILLLIAFIISWVLIILKYIRFEKKVKRTDYLIKELKDKDKKEQNESNPNSSRKT